MDSINEISYYLNKCYIKHITDDNFFFQEDSAQVHFACNTIQLSENVIFVFPHFDRQCRSTSYLRWHSKASFDCLLYRQHFCPPKNIKIHSRVSKL